MEGSSVSGLEESNSNSGLEGSTLGRVASTDGSELGNANRDTIGCSTVGSIEDNSFGVYDGFSVE